MDALNEDFDGFFDVLVLVGAADEAGFVGGGGEVDAVGEGVVEELFEGAGVAGGGLVVVADGLFGEEAGEHGADLGYLEGDAFLVGGIL